MKLSRRSALLLPLALGGCSWFDFLTDEAKPPIKGNREPILEPKRGLVPDAVGNVTLPPVESTEWPQAGRVPSHLGGNLAGGLTKAWSRDIGRGGDYRARITAQPLVVGGNVYTMDTDGLVSGWNLAGGHELWSTRTRGKKSRSTNLGGGICFDSGKIYAATGRAELLALDAASGSILWRKDLPAPARSAPTCVNGQLFVCTIDQKLLALSANGGDRQWSYQATTADIGVLAQASPAYDDGIVVAGFESGDLSAVRADTGTLVWSDNLGTLRGSASLLEFASIRGAPVIKNGIVYAIGFGGLLAGLDLRSGRRVWERDVAGGNTPWIAGDVMYVIDSDQHIAAVDAADGSVFWASPLARFTNPKKTKGLITWTGPIMVGGKLIAVSTHERMAIIDPVFGKLVSVEHIPSSASVSPVAGEGTMLVLTDDARLTAYK
jgi:outer membrane protein assembly factor BamB